MIKMTFDYRVPACSWKQFIHAKPPTDHRIFIAHNDKLSIQIGIWDGDVFVLEHAPVEEGLTPPYSIVEPEDGHIWLDVRDILPSHVRV